MTLATGTRLGHYEILSPLGAGGMGEVYRAKDPRLGREVAIKVLPEALALDRDRLSRFEQEARAASALNHPNIVTIHEIGREEGIAFIAMELVEGKTVRELIAFKPMPVRRLLNVAAQIADGLSKAHAAGIVHRDLKPDNVMVSKDGFVKILDFGLAKLVEPASGEVSVMPTMTAEPTQPGTVLGTVGYMSPEQASGEPLDFRSDQFSLGSIVYEMATGKKAFQRKTAAETMSAIIREQPEPLAKLRPDLPSPVQWILERCLSKDREDRYASTKDLARDLAGVRDRSEASSGAEEMSPALRRRRRGIWLLAAAAALGAGLAVAWGIAHGLAKGPAPAPSFKRLTFRQRPISTARFAPDGQTIIYGSGDSLYMTRPQSPESTLLPFAGEILSVSRSGELALLQSLRPVGRGVLATVPMAGGTPRQVLTEVSYGGADWSPNGKDLVVLHVADDKFRMESPIGKVIAFGEFGSPRFSADGGTISFWEASGSSNSVGVIDRLGKAKRILSAGWTDIAGVPCWAANGREIWFTAGKGEKPALWRVDLSGKLRLAIRVPGILELDDISRDGRVLLTHNTVLQSVRGLGPGQSTESDLSWLDGPMPADLSQDGAMLLLNEEGEGTGARPTIYLRGTDGSPALRLSEGVGMGLSPDKQWVVAIVQAGGEKPARLVLFPTGPGEPRDLPTERLKLDWGVFTPDGKSVVISAQSPDGVDGIYVLDIAAGKTRAIGPADAYLMDYTSPVSPDGRSVIAYRKGLPWVYPIEGDREARAVPGVARADRVIQWSADSRSVYTFSPRERPLKIFLLDLKTGERRLWKELPLDEWEGRIRVRVTPDGRFYVYGTTATRSELYLVDALR